MAASKAASSGGGEVEGSFARVFYGERKRALSETGSERGLLAALAVRYAFPSLWCGLPLLRTSCCFLQFLLALGTPLLLLLLLPLLLLSLLLLLRGGSGAHHVAAGLLL